MILLMMDRDSQVWYGEGIEYLYEWEEEDTKKDIIRRNTRVLRRSSRTSKARTYLKRKR